MAESLTASFPNGTGVGQLTKGLRLRNTTQLLEDKSQVDRLLQTAFAIELTDLYLYIEPSWYTEKADELAALNAKLNAIGLRVWAFYGDVAYLLTVQDTDRFITGLTKIGDFNDSVQSNARFYGFQVEIELPDTPTQPTGFHVGVPDSQLSPEHYVERGVLLHQWLNLLTRSGNLVHSYDMQFGSAMPWWLHDYEGEPVTMLWAKGKTCVMELVMPTVDEYLVFTRTAEVKVAVARAREQVLYASTQAKQGKEMPRVVIGHDLTGSSGKQLACDNGEAGRHDSAAMKTNNDLFADVGGYAAFGGEAMDG